MLRLKLYLILLGCVSYAFAEDVTVNILPLQDTKAVAADQIEIYNETNGSSLVLDDLTQSTTTYAINLSTGTYSEGTADIGSNTRSSDSFSLYRNDNFLTLRANVTQWQSIQISVFDISGKKIYHQRHEARPDENWFDIPMNKNDISIVKVNTPYTKEVFKVSTAHLPSRSAVYQENNIEAVSRSARITGDATSYSYTPGDRIHFTVSKGGLNSRVWMGAPETGDNISIAVPKNDRKFDMAQTLSTGAQINTIAYSGVAFYTGCLYASTFYPPGKVADYFGFQYFRDNDQDEGGHNTDFLTKAAYHTIHLLDDEQLGILIDLAEEQDSLIAAYAYARMPVIKAFHRYLDGDLPTSTSQLSESAVREASKAIYRIDGELSYGRAEAFSTVIKSMTQEQKDYLYDLNAVGMQTWDMPEKPKSRNIPKDLNTHVMTNASEMFSWFLGSIEADIYFCPERQGTYFGGFFMKDAPAMGNAGYAIDMETTANKGAYLLSNILDNTQKQKIQGIYSSVTDELDSIAAIRELISEELRQFLVQDNIDKEAILEWSEKYGEYDGSYIYTMADQFVEVANTFTSQQNDTLIWLRELEDFPCKEDTVYLYSKEIVQPDMGDTDLFFEY